MYWVLFFIFLISLMRYLTKSRYKLGLECPSKLFYTNKPKNAFFKSNQTTFNVCN